MAKKKAPVRTYRGYREWMPDLFGAAAVSRGCHVRIVDGEIWEELPPRLDLANKSPTGFEWGYGGSGPAQLAVALIADACGDQYVYPDVFQRFKFKVISALPKDGWTLTIDQVRAHVEAICNELDCWPVEDAEQPAGWGPGR